MIIKSHYGAFHIMSKVFTALFLLVLVSSANAGLILFINPDVGDTGIVIQAAVTDTQTPTFNVVTGLDLTCLGELPNPTAEFVLDIDGNFFELDNVAIQRDTSAGDTNITVTTVLGNLSCSEVNLEEVFFSDGFENEV